MARKKLEDKLVPLSSIQEEMRLIDGSDTDYITPTGKVYKWYHDDMYYPKKVFQNKYNNYMYVNVYFKDKKIRSRRQHVLMAKAYIPNPDPERLKIVGHRDDVKWHNELDNLYWTNNQENTQSAVNHKLNVSKVAEQNENSIYIKVLDKDSKEIVGIYGSIRECARCIDNITVGMIAKMYKLEDYKPRSRKYIYQVATEEEFNQNLHLRSKHLVESLPVNKKPKVFYLINDAIGYKKKFDNQVTASKVCNIPQATISNMIKTGRVVNGWRCIYVDEIDYVEASSYENLIKMQNQIILQHIKTKEIKIYGTAVELREEFQLQGHDIQQYFKTGHTLMNEWKIISIESKDVNYDTKVNKNIS